MSNFFNENSFIHWIRANSNNIFYGLLTLIALLFIMYKSGSSYKAQSQTDFFTVERNYQKLLKNVEEGSNKETFDESFRSLKKLLITHPELNEKYDAPLVQLLLLENENTTAISFSEQVFPRTRKNDLPAYQRFAAISLLIANKDFEQALHQSVALSELLEKQTETDTDFGYIQNLQDYNLIRIAYLEQHLGLNDQALASWKKIEELFSSTTLGDNTKDKLFFRQLFSEGNISFENYLQNQIQSLERVVGAT